MVYRSIHGVVGLIGHGLDSLLARLAPLLGERGTWPGREASLAALNGVLGDYLAASSNPLAITMCWDSRCYHLMCFVSLSRRSQIAEALDAYQYLGSQIAVA